MLLGVDFLMVGSPAPGSIVGSHHESLNRKKNGSQVLTGVVDEYNFTVAIYTKVTDSFLAWVVSYSRHMLSDEEPVSIWVSLEGYSSLHKTCRAGF